MLYIKKRVCPPAIQAEIDRIIDRDEWPTLPEESGTKEQTEYLRKNYFDKLRNKNDIRKALSEEQHGLCAYCMTRIQSTGETTIIEHWYPLSKSKTSSMDYQNFLAVCNGGEGPAEENRILCCDKKKGDKVAVLSPLNEEMMSHIAYSPSGLIRFEKKNVPKKHINARNAELNSIYGLNGSIDNHGNLLRDTATGLVKNRKDAYEEIDDILQGLLEDDELTAEWIHETIENYTSEPQWEPYVGVKLYVLKTYLDILSTSSER